MTSEAVALNLNGVCGRHGQAGQCAGGFPPHTPWFWLG